MKVLRILLIILLSIVGIFIILGILGPKEEEFERSITINAPLSYVYEHVNSLEDMANWSPWYEIDPDATHIYKGESGQVGSSHRWESTNDSLGVGTQTITELSRNEIIKTHLAFEKPFPMESDAWVRLEQKNESSTEVFWGFHADYAFFTRPMMLFMDIKKPLSHSYDKGLQKLKDWILSRPKAFQEVKQKDVPAQKYLVKRKKIDIADLEPFTSRTMSEFGVAMGQEQFTPSGPMVSLYYLWDTVEQITDVAVGFPIEEVSSMTPFDMIQLPSSHAIVYRHVGDYSDLGVVHNTLEEYAATFDLEIQHPAIEKYILAPDQSANPAEWITEVIYLTQKQ